MSQGEDKPTLLGQIDVSTFLRKWHYFVVSVSVCLLLGGLHYLLVTPTYSVSARVLVEEIGRPLNDESRTIGRDASFLPTHAEILSSPSVIRLAIPKMDLEPISDPEESPVDKILKRLDVRPLVGTQVLSVAYQDSDPQKAVRALELIIDSYRDYLDATEHTANQETIVLLAERADSLRQETRSLHEKYRELRQESPLLGADHDSAAVQRNTLMRLQDELVVVKSRRITLENQLETLVALQPEKAAGQFALVANNPAGDLAVDERAMLEVLARLAAEGIVGSRSLQTDLDSLLEAELTYAEFRKNYGDRHPEVEATAERVAALNQRLEAVITSAPAMIRREVESLERQEKNLASLYATEFTRAKGVDKFLVQEKQLLDEMELVKATHDTVVTKLNELQVADSGVSGGRSSVAIRVLDGPELTDELVWPQPIPLLGLCLVAGFAAGAALVFTSEHLRHETVARLLRRRRLENSIAGTPQPGGV